MKINKRYQRSQLDTKFCSDFICHTTHLTLLKPQSLGMMRSRVFQNLLAHGFTTAAIWLRRCSMRTSIASAPWTALWASHAWYGEQSFLKFAV